VGNQLSGGELAPLSGLDEVSGRKFVEGSHHERLAGRALPRAFSFVAGISYTLKEEGMPMTDTMNQTHGVTLTDQAALKVKNLLEQEGRDDLRLRVAVQPGGCSGLIYQLFFDERLMEDDLVRDFNGVEVVVDKMSSPYVEGAAVDFEDTIQKQGFTIDNPNAEGSCACGDSFG